MNKKALIKSVSNYVQSGGETKPPVFTVKILNEYPIEREGPESDYFTVRDQYPIELTVKEVVHGSHIAFRETSTKLFLNSPMVRVLREQKDWVGKKLTLYLDLNVKFQDKVVSGVRIKPL